MFWESRTWPSLPGEVLVKSRLRPHEGLPCLQPDGNRLMSVLSCPSTCGEGHSTGWTAGDTGSGTGVSLPPGTSNWSEDYFSSTAGVGLVVSQTTPDAPPGVTPVQEQLRRIFERDWSSRYAMGLGSQVPSQDCT